MYYIHVNKNVIASNRKHGKSDPAVRIQKGKYGKPVYAFRVKFRDGEMIYSPYIPILPCGVRLVIQTPHVPEIIE
jgi:hypothetical protein